LRNGGHFLEFWQKYLSGSRGRFFATFFAPDWAKKVEAESDTTKRLLLIRKYARTPDWIKHYLQVIVYESIE